MGMKPEEEIAALRSKVAKQRNELARLEQKLSACAHEKLALIRELKQLKEKLDGT